MKKITIIINSLLGGGAEKICHLLALELTKRNYEIDLIVFESVSNDLEEEVKAKVSGFISFETINTKKSFFHLSKYLRENADRTILCFGHQIAITLYLIKKMFFTKNKIICRNISTLSKQRNIHNTFFNKYLVELITKFLYKQIDIIIAQSNGMASDLVSNYGINKDKIKVILNPVREPIYSDKASKDSFILFVGKMKKAKGAYYLANVFNQVHQKKEDIKLYIVGPDGEETEKFKQILDQLSLTEYVKFEGMQNDLSYYYTNAELTVLTSIYEGLPNVLIESISYGTPIVSFDTPSGPSEIIIEEENGYLCDYLNIDDMSSKILSALEQKWDKQKVRSTSQKFQIEIILNQYIKVLDE